MSAVDRCVFYVHLFKSLSGQLDFCLAEIPTSRREEPIFADEVHVIQYAANVYSTRFAFVPV